MSDKFNGEDSLIKQKNLKKTRLKSKSLPTKKRVSTQKIKVQSSSKDMPDASAEWKKGSTLKLPSSKQASPENSTIDQLSAKENAKASRAAIYKANRQRLKDNPQMKEIIEKKKAYSRAKRKVILEKRKIKLQQEKIAEKNQKNSRQRSMKESYTDHFQEGEFFHAKRPSPVQKFNNSETDRSNISQFKSSQSDTFEDKTQSTDTKYSAKSLNDKNYLDDSHQEMSFGNKKTPRDSMKKQSWKFNFRADSDSSGALEGQADQVQKKPDKKSHSPANGKSKQKKEILLRTASNPELRSLADIIAVDFINKKRKKS